MRSFVIAGIMVAAAVGSGAALPPSAPAQSASSWEIGPIIRGRNYSVGMPLQPTPSGRGWHFDFPFPNARAGHVHYVTFNPGSLAGKSKIVVRYRVETAPGTRFVPQEMPGAPATVSLFLQRRGDNWSGRGPYAWYRWYAPGSTVREVAPGEHELTVSLTDGWTSVLGKPSANNPGAFEDALADPGKIGLVFGTHAARGHGVYATGPARFTLTSFRLL